jgi:putative endonuclease
MTYVYILRSIRWRGQLYAGSTTDFAARLIAHNQGKSPHTSTFSPWELIYQEHYESQGIALKREKQIKRRSRKKKLVLVSGNLEALKELAKRKVY